MTKKKPPIGFEPMTYALPWRYSTAELKGHLLSQLPNKELAYMNMSLVHLFVTAYTYYIYYIFIEYIYIYRYTIYNIYILLLYFIIL